MKRRHFLRGAAGTALALPFLEYFASDARGQTAGNQPTRLLIFHQPQGTLTRHWRPTVTASGLTLPTITSPIDDYPGLKDKCLFVSGIDQKLLWGHGGSDRTLWTCRGWGVEPGVLSEYDQGHAAGPSVEQVVADRIGQETPLRRLDLAVGGGQYAQESPQIRHFYHAANEAVTSRAVPSEVFDDLFSVDDSQADERERLRFHRRSVLDAVQLNLSHLRARVGREDRIRLDAHAARVRELEQRLGAMPLSCGTPPTLTPSADFDWRHDEDEAARMMADMMALALSCGITNVGTFDFANGHAPTFSWLNSGSGPTTFPGAFENWHDLVHLGRDDSTGTYEPDLIAGYRWYMEVFAYLLNALDQLPDGDGTALDSTLVVAGSEFGNGGGHASGNLQAIFAGNLAGAQMGRFIDYFDLIDTGGDPHTSYTNDARPGMHHLSVTILQAFGVETETFGTYDSLGTGWGFGTENPISPGALPFV